MTVRNVTRRGVELSLTWVVARVRSILAKEEVDKPAKETAVKRESVESRWGRERGGGRRIRFMISTTTLYLQETKPPCYSSIQTTTFEKFNKEKMMMMMKKKAS